MRVFLAGATGVIAIRLVPLLAGCGHQVAGMTRSYDKTAQIAALGAQPVVSDVFDAAALLDAVSASAPDLVMHQLTDLPTTSSRSPTTPSATTGSAPKGRATS